MTMASAVRGQSLAPSPTRPPSRLVAWSPTSTSPWKVSGPLPALIVLGGSRGGLDERTAWEAKALAEHGYASPPSRLYRRAGPADIRSSADGPSSHSAGIFEAAIDWLRTHPTVDPNRIGVVGTSIGGMAALLVAAHYPDLRVVVAAVPSSVVWSTFGSSRISMFSRSGQPLPYLPYGLGRGSGVHNLFDDGLNALAQHADAIIPVERVNGPVMVICGKLDSLWPSCRMSAQSRLAWRPTPSSAGFKFWNIQMPDIRCSVRPLRQRIPLSPRLEAREATRPELILAQGSRLH